MLARRSLVSALLGLALVLVASLVAVADAAPAWAAPALLAVGVLAIDLLERRRFAPSIDTLAVAAAIVAGSAIVGAADPDDLPAMLPIFAALVATPLLRSRRGVRECSEPRGARP